MKKIALAALLALAGCGSARQAPTPAETPTAAASAVAAAPTPGPAASSAMAPAAGEDAAALESRDCRAVVQAYANAIARNDFGFAARVWGEPAITSAQLSARFSDFAVPQITISRVDQDGAAGSLYCTVKGTLTDVADPSKAPRAGEIVLRRVNDVPGATPEQLRWTIRSSTFVGTLQH